VIAFYNEFICVLRECGLDSRTTFSVQLTGEEATLRKVIQSFFPLFSPGTHTATEVEYSKYTVNQVTINLHG